MIDILKKIIELEHKAQDTVKEVENELKSKDKEINDIIENLRSEIFLEAEKNLEIEKVKYEEKGKEEVEKIVAAGKVKAKIMEEEAGTKKSEWLEDIFNNIIKGA